MQKFVCTFLFICLGFTATSQVITDTPTDSIKQDTVIRALHTNLFSLKGRIISIVDKKPLQSAHVVNLNSVEGTITNTNGQFEIPAVVNDTIFISYIGISKVKPR